MGLGSVSMLQTVSRACVAVATLALISCWFRGFAGSSRSDTDYDIIAPDGVYVVLLNNTLGRNKFLLRGNMNGIKKYIFEVRSFIVAEHLEGNEKLH